MRRLATSRLTSITAISRAPREKSGAKGKRDISLRRLARDDLGASNG
jgi:hypothetical protein